MRLGVIGIKRQLRFIVDLLGENYSDTHLGYSRYHRGNVPDCLVGRILLYSQTANMDELRILDAFPRSIPIDVYDDSTEMYEIIWYDLVSKRGRKLLAKIQNYQDNGMSWGQIRKII